MNKFIPAVVLAMASAVSAHAEVLTTGSHVPGLQLRLRHTTAGATRGLPVLFLHGSSFPSALAFDFPMDGVSWMDSLAARGHNVYALDFLGYGLSDRYPPAQQPQGRALDVVQDVDRAVELVLARSGARQVALVAHSWGGSVGALYAERHPEKVGKLVLFAAITARNQSTPRAQVAPYQELTPAQRIAGMDGLRPAGEASQLHADVHKRWGADWLASDRRADNAAVVRFPSGPSADADDLSHGRPYYDPARIKAPTLLVRGEWDTWPSDADYKLLRGRMTGAAEREYAVIPRGTHVMHLELAHGALWQAVERFLER
ncbi:alpha/beta fold hydrolase [Pseudoduganella violacea]|uniref:Pimeloyl-ACP methyl ester carboxylesterase n=1 Tax=Pseudoduganella violacea TaxID=1715466 RepID=A0A7W5B9D4_9BURK|nr:alpha/beta hydrolase [Pseudoduganella violacea]MBB3118275.1 pimeloyl-ACP methyl ester carboxylesterase [Pseudoduganella violacea]